MNQFQFSRVAKEKSRPRAVSHDSRAESLGTLIWSNFEEVTFNTSNGRPQKIQKCINCGDRVSAKADRLRIHFAKCTKASTATRGFTGSESDSSTSCDTDGPSSPSNVRIQKKLPNYFQCTTPDKKAELDKLAARFWYSCNLSFNSAGLQTWTDFCTSMRPGYVPPSVHMLQGRLLDENYQDLFDEMTGDLKNNSGIIVQDGWSDIHNSPILTHTIVCNGEAYILNSVECAADRKTSEYCAEKFIEAMEIANTFEFTTIGGSTDNCNTMIRMREILQEKLPGLLVYGCSPHMMNKLCEDISVKSIIAKIVEVSKYFRDHHRPSALLNEKGGLKPQLPANTRWSSHLECIRIFLKNRIKYIEIAQEEECPNNISETVNSLAVFKYAQDLLTQLEAITGEMLKLQSDEATIADACHSWFKLLRCPALAPHTNSVKRRMKLATEEFFLIAYHFHPKLQGNLMTGEERNKCFDIILEKDSTWVPIAQAFYAKNPAVFPRSALHDVVMSMSNPIDWWKSQCNNEKIPDGFLEYLYLLPMYLCTPSTASVERVFSTFGFIQTDHRNRLSQDKLMKLAFCFRALRRDDRSHQRPPRNILSIREGGEAQVSPSV